jgi:hypothetical protein
VANKGNLGRPISVPLKEGFGEKVTGFDKMAIIVVIKVRKFPVSADLGIQEVRCLVERMVAGKYPVNKDKRDGGAVLHCVIVRLLGDGNEI